MEFLRTIWSDPVWSKVIATLILGVLGIVVIYLLPPLKNLALSVWEFILTMYNAILSNPFILTTVILLILLFYLLKRQRLRLAQSASEGAMSQDRNVHETKDISDGDALNILESWFKSLSPKDQTSAIHFKNVDKIKDLPTGTSKRLLEKAVLRLGGFVTKSHEDTTIMFKRKSRPFTVLKLSR